MKRAYRFVHFQIRRFGVQIEIACFNKHGGFLWAFYLPRLKLLTRRTFNRKMKEKIKQREDNKEKQNEETMDEIRLAKKIKQEYNKEE